MTRTPAASAPGAVSSEAQLDPDAAISVRGLVKRYGDRNAVDGVDLDIRRGEIFALLGPNGAGKTTTVEVLEGYRQRDGGDVRVLGVDPARDLRPGIVAATTLAALRVAVNAWLADGGKAHLPTLAAEALDLLDGGLQYCVTRAEPPRRKRNDPPGEAVTPSARRRPNAG